MGKKTQSSTFVFLSCMFRQTSCPKKRWVLRILVTNNASGFPKRSYFQVLLQLRLPEVRKPAPWWSCVVGTGDWGVLRLRAGFSSGLRDLPTVVHGSLVDLLSGHVGIARALAQPHDRAAPAVSSVGLSNFTERADGYFSVGCCWFWQWCKTCRWTVKK